MFAKVFGQIFDSSIAEDYNTRRMFMDLLVLADSDGVVDMTLEAISRRTNVPLDVVTRYVRELEQPDETSRSKAEEGKRIVKISDERDWGWQIVNYQHYRKIKDEEARRSYFRDAQRKHRDKVKKGKALKVKDKGLTGLDTNGQLLTPASPSSSISSSVLIRGETVKKEDIERYCTGLGLPASDGTAMFLHWKEKGTAKVKDWKLTIQKWKSFGYLPSQKQIRGGQPKPKLSDPNQSRIDEEYEQHRERMERKRAAQG